MKKTFSQDTALLHARIEGISRDIPLTELDLGPLSTDEEVRLGLATYFGISSSGLASTVVERHESGNLTVRPEAVFG